MRMCYCGIMCVLDCVYYNRYMEMYVYENVYVWECVCMRMCVYENVCL
jgi:hypothetical protein